MPKSTVYPYPQVRHRLTGPHWLIRGIMARLCGGDGPPEPFLDPDGQEVSWKANVYYDSILDPLAWDLAQMAWATPGPYGQVTAELIVELPPAPPKPDIPALIAKWRETFAPADREALWKALSGKGGYILDGVRYLAAQPCMGSDQRYSIEVS